MSRFSPFTKMFRFQGNTKCQHLIILSIFFAMVELSQSCHRKVEYYHYPKKPPPPPPPPPHHYGGHKGPHGGHGGGYGHGHSGGYKHGGHGQHGHKGYGHHDPHDHGGGGYGGGHGHHEDEGYGHQHKGYEPEGHGHGYEPYGGGGYGHDDEYSHRGHRHNGYGGGGHGHGHGKGHGGKGRRYKYQMYESMRYHEKGHPRHPPSHSHGHSHSYGQPSYSQNVPHYLKQGYGYSGPYPNVEYSNPIGSSVNPPTYSPDSFNTGILKGITVHQHLDAADTADLIRQNSKENEIVSNPTASDGDGDDVYGTSNENLDKPSIEFTIVPGISQEVGEADFIETSSGTQADPTNFDLNLNFNSDLPVPFQRSAFDSKRVSNNGRKKPKRLSSRYRRRENGRKKGSNESLPPTDTETSQSVNKVQKVEPPPKLKTEQSKVDDQKKNVTKS